MNSEKVGEGVEEERVKDAWVVFEFDSASLRLPHI